MGRPRKLGRRKGAATRGYYYRRGRGWYTRGNRRLYDEQGQPLKLATDAGAAQRAYLRLEAHPGPSASDAISVGKACQLYLEHVERHGAAATYAMRADFLFDFCTGFASQYRCNQKTPTEKERLHAGFHHRPLAGLKPLDLADWLAVHPGWRHPRPAVQAMKRMCNYCREMGLVVTNPIQGFKTPLGGMRVTYFTPEVEQAIYEHASRALAVAVKVCIFTGARPIVEFGSVEKRHVEINEKGDMLWRFPPEEAKVRSKPRTIHIPPSIKPLVVAAMDKYPTGPLFRRSNGQPWTLKAMGENFARLRQKLIRLTVPIEPADVMYTCRHTYAKRQLGGFWTGTGVSLEVLAGLMGNTPAVCWHHYGQWCERYTDPLRQAVRY